jgi:signal transduction histidine kinase/ActR/RegA family two-component response regulator
MRPTYLQAMHELGASPDAIDGVIDDLDIGLFVDHPERGCIYASDEVLRMFELPWERFCGFGWAASVLEADMAVLQTAIEQYEVDKGVIDVRYRIRRPDGSLRALHVIGHAVLDDRGEQIGSVMIGRDETDERALRDHAMQQQKLEAIGRLSGRVAHDINNVLTPMMCAASLLELEEGLSDEGREHLAIVMQAVQHAAGITRQLLTLSKQQVTTRRVVGLDTELRQLEPLLRQSLGEGIQLTVRADAAGVLVGMADHELGQVLLNLCVNARDAVAGRGAITVLSRRTNGHCEVVVSDDGPGVPVDVRQRMFEPFFTTKPADRGTGLGLSTVLELVQRAGGEIAVQSHLGQGTTFTIRLPVVGIGQPASVQAGTADLAPLHVLLVDDNAALRQTLAYVLALRGHSVCTAATVADAVQRLGEDPVDLLVTDVLLPDGHGPDLAATARASHPGLPVILMSGYAGADLAEDTLLQPHTLFLQKPFHPNRLAQALGEVTSARAARQRG